jgi:hypothetical protein
MPLTRRAIRDWPAGVPPTPREGRVGADEPQYVPQAVLVRRCSRPNAARRPVEQNDSAGRPYDQPSRLTPLISRHRTRAPGDYHHWAG